MTARVGRFFALPGKLGYIGIMLPAHRRSRRRSSAGFTMVELMAVVVITGILATLGVVMVRKHFNAAKSNRALAGMQAIRAAEEAFRAQNGRYLDVSTTPGPKWYPMENPGTATYDWRQPDHDDWTRWQALGVIRLAPTQYGFLVNAGIPGAPYPDLHTTNDPALPQSPLGTGGGTGAASDWYVIQAKGDLDGNGVFFQAIATSTTASVYVERDSE